MYAKDLDVGELIQEQLSELKTVHFFPSLRRMLLGHWVPNIKILALSSVPFQVHIVPLC